MRVRPEQASILTNADADPPAIWRRLHERRSNRHAHRSIRTPASIVRVRPTLRAKFEKIRNCPDRDRHVHGTERKLRTLNQADMEPPNMCKIGIGLSALLILAAAAKPGTAQHASAVASPQHPACIWYEAVEFPGCVNYGSLSEDEARTARGHPQFVEPVYAATGSQARGPSATLDHPAQIVPTSRQ